MKLYTIHAIPIYACNIKISQIDPNSIITSNYTICRRKYRTIIIYHLTFTRKTQRKIIGLREPDSRESFTHPRLTSRNTTNKTCVKICLMAICWYLVIWPWYQKPSDLDTFRFRSSSDFHQVFPITEMTAERTNLAGTKKLLHFPPNNGTRDFLNPAFGMWPWRPCRKNRKNNNEFSSNSQTEQLNPQVNPW